MGPCPSGSLSGRRQAPRTGGRLQSDAAGWELAEGSPAVPEKGRARGALCLTALAGARVQQTLGSIGAGGRAARWRLCSPPLRKRPCVLCPRPLPASSVRVLCPARLVSSGRWCSSWCGATFVIDP